MKQDEKSQLQSLLRVPSQLIYPRQLLGTCGKILCRMTADAYARRLKAPIGLRLATCFRRIIYHLERVASSTDRDSVSAFRIFAGLIQLTLVLLLTTAAPSMAFDRSDDGRMVALQSLVSMLPADQDPGDDGTTGCASDSDQLSSDGPGFFLLSFAEKPAFAFTRVIETSRVAYAPLFSSHHPCAAPSTGPPLA